MKDELVELRTFASVQEAEVAASALEAAGIDCSIREQYTGRMDPQLVPAMGGVPLLVPASQLEAARQLLDEGKPQDAGEDEEGAACAECGRPLHNALAECPVCNAHPGSTRLTPKRTHFSIIKLKLAIIVFFLLVIAAPTVWDRIAGALTGIPDRYMSTGLYVAAGTVLAIILVRGLSSMSDRRL